MPPILRSTRAGRYVAHPRGFHSFQPAALPPEPDLDLSRLTRLLSEADSALGRLEGAAWILPNPDLFVAMYVRQEAVLSSQIEGTQASLTDLLLFEAGQDDDGHTPDVEEVFNYVRAMNHGLQRLRADEFPLSLRLIREIHAELMQGVRGQEKDPGEFRRSPVWIGPRNCSLQNATFVPPAEGPELMSALGELEHYLYDQRYPNLIHAGLVHAQFETIHPFLDGNGRMGRLLITFLLCQRQVLSKPLLYLSYFLKQHRAEYYDRLQAIRTDGHWEEWLAFFLRGIREVADQATSTARRILAMREEHRRLLEREGKASGNMVRALDTMFHQPYLTPKALAEALDLNYQTANTLLARLSELGLVTEQTGYKRNRKYAYQPYLALFEEPGGDSGPGSTPPREVNT
ncbi:MAG: Fic family protein [Candidatus Sericytochromatia bacterium]|nr:Fic family protein [Candidatus Sericytochromatia bacterium]